MKNTLNVVSNTEEHHADVMPFIDLASQQERLRPSIDKAIQRVLDHGMYIMGPEVSSLEHALEEFCGVKHAISCSNGTDALVLGLMVKGISAGDAVFVPGFTFAATAEAVAFIGATPVFVDIDRHSMNIDPESLKEAINVAKKMNLKPRGIIPVDLFGLPADYDAIQKIADENNLWVMADAAQSFGARYKDRVAGSIGDLATTSFFPAKPLGCYGDGGAIFTNDDQMADMLRSMRIHGQGRDRYDNIRIGMTGRLDTIQAAILLEKLSIFQEEINKRQYIAELYTEWLQDSVKVPIVDSRCQSVWAQYTIQLPDGVDRSKVIEYLKNMGIPTMVYYFIPLHHQKAYDHFPRASGSLNVCEELSSKVLSLPMSAYVTENQVERVAKGLISALKQA